MNRKILFGLAFLLLAVCVFSIPKAQAAEVSPSKVVLTAQEKVALEQSLTALAEVLTSLQLSLKESKTLPPNIDKIVVSLGEIGNSLAKINASIEGKALASANDNVASVAVKPEAVSSKNSEAIAQKTDENVSPAESGNYNEDVSVPASNNSGSLMAEIKSLFSPKIGVFVVIVLLIGFGVFLMKGKKETEQPQNKVVSKPAN